MQLQQQTMTHPVFNRNLSSQHKIHKNKPIWPASERLTMSRVPAHSEHRQIIRTRLSSHAGSFPLLLPVLSFASWEEQSKEAAWDGEAGGSQEAGELRGQLDQSFEGLGMSPGSAPSLLCGLGGAT